MPVFLPPANCVAVSLIVTVIAIDPMVRIRLQRVLNTVRGVEIHVCNPHGNAGFVGNTIKRLHFVPLRAVGSSAINCFVKVHGDASLQNVGHISDFRAARKGVATALSLS